MMFYKSILKTNPILSCFWRCGKLQYYYITGDYDKAFYWIKKAAEQGDVQAQFNLAICYYNGQGVSKDLKQAIYWYQKAAGQGFVEAKERLKLLEK